MATLYEETLYSKWITLFLVPPLVAMVAGLYIAISTILPSQPGREPG